MGRGGGLGRYFGYRRLYVDAILERAPRRATLAVASEIARLGFVLFGCALVGIVFVALVIGATERLRGIGLWPVVFACCAAVDIALGLGAATGIVRAARDLPRVRSAAAARDG